MKHVLSGAPGSARARTARPVVEALEERCLLSGDVVLQWNGVALDALKNDYALGHTPEQGGPTRDSRALAIVQVAVYDAVNLIDGSYASFLDLTGAPSAAGASLDAAAAQAGHDTLAQLYPQQVATFDAALAASLAAVPNGPAKARGIAVGQFIAAQCMASRADDHSGDMMTYSPTNPPVPGHHQVDPLHPGQGFLGPMWGDVTGFGIADMAQFRSPPPPALGSPEYAAALEEVALLGGDGVTTPTLRTPEETQIGIFWGYDGSPGLGTPPREYNQIVRIVAQQEHNTVVQNARLLALVNVAMADAAIQAWDTKYVYDFWRPVVAIRAAGTDGNPLTVADPNWSPLGAPRSNDPTGTNFTPPFPAYTSGHATFGGATFRTLADFYGRDDIGFSFTSDEFNGVTRDQDGSVRPVVTRTFQSFSQAAEENGQSRIYLGIHWRFDKEQGIRAGDSIADYVFAHMLRPRTPGHDPATPPPAALLAAVAAQQTNAYEEHALRSIVSHPPATTHPGTPDTPERRALVARVAQSLARVILAEDLPAHAGDRVRDSALQDLAFLALDFFGPDDAV